MFLSLSGHILSLNTVVTRGCGCREHHGTVCLFHPDERVVRSYLLDRLISWHDHGDDAARILAHAHGLPTDELERFIKEDLAARFIPRVRNARPFQRCRDCGSPYDPRHPLALPPAAGAGPHIVNVGLGIQTNLIGGLGGTVPKYVGQGTGTGTTALTDTDLFTPTTEARVAGTVTRLTTTQTNDTLQVQGTITAAAAETITNAGVFDAATAGNLYMKGDFTGIALSANDSISYTFKDQQTTS